MTAHSYSLRSRVSSSSLSTRSGPQSPLQGGTRTPRKGQNTAPVLQLRHVIGTTTTTPSGLSCCETIDSYAYTAGAVAVLATLDSHSSVSYRYFKARPTAVPLNQTISYYDSPSAANTPTRRRTTFVPVRNGEDVGGGTPQRIWSEDGSSQTWSARERIKAATCVALSPDGKILAVGETGYNPRVLLFSTAVRGSTDIPLSIITDHNIGVCSIAFSPNSRYLATLGDVNDGFLYIWQVNTTTGTLRLHSSNKCTTNVYDMTWIGDHVVTVGTRHVKVWQASPSSSVASPRRARLRNEGEVFSPTPVPLHGRNCVLGDLVDATFTSVVAISELQAVLCADDGHHCLLDLKSGKPELLPFEKSDTTVTVTAYRQNLSRVVWIDRDNVFQQRDSRYRDLSKVGFTEQMRETCGDIKPLRKTSRQSIQRRSLGLSPLVQGNTVALGCLNNHAVCVSTDGTVQVLNIDTGDANYYTCAATSHNGSVQGVAGLHPEAKLGSFYTWAKNGELRFWTDAGHLVNKSSVTLDESMGSDELVSNELKIVRYWRAHNLVVTGDRFGILKVFSLPSWTCTQDIRAHGAEISDVDIESTSNVMATCSRDRTVQIFTAQEGNMELVQTCDDHISAVTQVMFNHNGSRLISCSADRTAVIRDRIQRDSQTGAVLAYVPTRTVTLKAAPLSMCIVPTQPDILAISTMDRHLVKVDIRTGTLLNTFKFSDPESDDKVFLNTIGLTSPGSGGRCLLIGFSSIDKSVRVYDLEKGTLLGRDAGHTEGISDIRILRNDTVEGSLAETRIVSTGLDGTIMIWSLSTTVQSILAPKQDLSQSQSSLESDSGEVTPKINPTSLPPLRKLLSKLDITGVGRQTSPTRETSPSGIRRRPSRLALASSIEEADESRPSQNLASCSKESKLKVAKRSPSPPTRLRTSPKKQRSYSELKMKDCHQPSSSTVAILPGVQDLSAVALKTRSKANSNSKLKRPPSIPGDLRTRANTSNKRSSVGSISNAGNINTATEQTCHMLRLYHQQLQDMKEDLDIDFDELEASLEAVLQTVKESKLRTTACSHDLTTMEELDDKDEVNEITMKLENAQLA